MPPNQFSDLGVNRRMRIRVWIAILGLASNVIIAPLSAEPPRQKLQPARFFYEPGYHQMLAAVRAGMDQRVNFNHKYSSSYVSCGPGCGTYFFVDRSNGGVVGVPEGEPPEVTTWDVISKPESNIITVTFGPLSGGIGSKCSAQHFRLIRHAFTATNKRRPIRCPE